MIKFTLWRTKFDRNKLVMRGFAIALGFSFRFCKWRLRGFTLLVIALSLSV